MNNITYSFNGSKFMILPDSVWVEAFFHNSSLGDFFVGESEVLSSFGQNKFSILGSIDSSYHISGKYEFLYEVPGYFGFNRWRQKLHPSETTISTNSTTNEFEPVTLSWSTLFNGGLSRSSSPQTFYDCSAGDNPFWWYPIGAKTSYMFPNSIPAIGDGGIIAFAIRLWVRIPISNDHFLSIPEKSFQCVYNPSFNFRMHLLFL